MALKISLKPGEQFVVNGAVITNGERRSSFVIQNKVSILRSRDILAVEEADTPAKRVYLPIMLSCLEPEKASSYYQEFVLRMTEFMNALENPEAQMACVSVSLEMMNRDFYKALSGCRKLMDYEAAALGVSDGSGTLSTRAKSIRAAA
jgi:flagellar biosynthesis repressor protein FlbT